MNIRFTLIPVVAALFLASPIAAQGLEPLLATLSTATRISGAAIIDPLFVRAVYAANGGKLLWTDPARFASLQKAIADSVKDGLTPADYHAAALANFKGSVGERDLLATDALVLLADGRYVGAIDGLRNWDDYLETMKALLQAAPSRPPTVGIPVRVADGGGGHCAA